MGGSSCPECSEEALQADAKIQRMVGRQGELEDALKTLKADTEELKRLIDVSWFVCGEVVWVMDLGCCLVHVSACFGDLLFCCWRLFG